MPHAFYARETVDVARDLLGRVLVHQTDGGIVAGRIVETEAYGPNDEANHAARGMTKRNASMFGAAGRAYVYKIYGMYWCLNAVTFDEGFGQAVLIRALEPLAGMEMMQANRRLGDARQLCKGPGRLCMAFGISGAMDGADLVAGPLTIRGDSAALEVVETTRIGITKAADFPWRFYVAGSPYISRK